MGDNHEGLDQSRNAYGSLIFCSMYILIINDEFMLDIYS